MVVNKINNSNVDLTLAEYIAQEEQRIINATDKGYPYQYYLRALRGIFGGTTTMGEMEELNHLIEEISELTVPEIIKSIANVQLRREIVEEFFRNVKLQAIATQGMVRQYNSAIDNTEKIQSYTRIMEGKFFVVKPETHEIIK